MDLDVVVIGGANVDYLVRGEALPRAGQTVVGHEFQQAMGGKGANQAIAAARLGARVAFVGRVGDDDGGTRTRLALADARVDVTRVVVDEHAPTGVALILVDAQGQKMIMTAPGANQRLSASDVAAAAALVDAAAVLLLQLEAPVPAVADAIRKVHARGGKVVLDAAPPTPVPDELLALLDVVRANADEAKALTGVPVRDRATAKIAARALLDRGVGAACIATGEADLLVWRDGEADLPRLPVDVVDSTGAGDAFAAGLAVGLAEGRSLVDAGWLGCAAAALKTTRLGAQAGLPRRAEVDELLRRSRLR